MIFFKKMFQILQYIREDFIKFYSRKSSKPGDHFSWISLPFFVILHPQRVLYTYFERLDGGTNFFCAILCTLFAFKFYSTSHRNCTFKIFLLKMYNLLQVYISNGKDECSYKYFRECIFEDIVYILYMLNGERERERESERKREIEFVSISCKKKIFIDLINHTQYT